MQKNPITGFMTVKPTEEKSSVIVDLPSAFNSFSTFSPIKKYALSMERILRVKAESTSADSPSQELLLYFKSEYDKLSESDLDFFLSCLQRKRQASSILPSLSTFLSEEVVRILREKPEDMGRRLYRLLRAVDAVLHNEECDTLYCVLTYPLLSI